MVTENYSKVTVMGEVQEEPRCIVKYGIEQIFETVITYKRTSGKTDTFVINYSAGTGVELHKGMFIHISEGTLRSTRYQGITKIYIKADVITVLDAEPEVYANEVELKGILVREPKLRKSYADDRTDISDMVIRVPRNQGKVSYIPVVAWNNNARLVLECTVGGTLTISGRLQSHTTGKGYLMTEVTATTFDFTA